MSRFIQTCLAATLALAALPAQAATICTYDPAGKSGEYYQLLSEFALEASAWGETIEIKAYTDEETASKDYEAGTCDGVVATGVRLQRFNRFPSTIEAMGALPSYDLLAKLVHTLATSDGAAKKLTHDGNETVGFISVGAAYLFVRDRSIDSVPKLAGKRIATMDYDKAAPAMVERVGAIIVPADLGTIGPKFNNGAVDICYVSAPAYEPFELHRGLADKGGILRSPLAQATLQVMVRPSKFSEGFGKKARTWFDGKFAQSIAAAKKAEGTIPAKYWVDIPASEAGNWDEMFREVRIHLRDDGAYDGSMLKVMRQLRCKADAARAECAEQKE